MNQDLATAIELITVPGKSCQEKLISEKIRSLLLEMGVSEENIIFDKAHQTSPYHGEVGNMIVRFPGKRTGRHLLLSTHMDTVPGAVGSLPRLDGQRIVNDAPGKALGIDARCGVAILMAAARSLVALKGDHPPRTMVIFVQEELGLVGSKHLDVSLLGEELPDMCFNFDGGSIEEVAHHVIGTERIAIDLTGVAMHTGRVHQGISCAVIFAEALAELHKAGWVGHVEKDGRIANSNPGILRGGTGSNVTMPALHCLAECRSFDLKFREQVLEAWRQAFRDAVERANQAAEKREVEGQASVTFTRGTEYPPYKLPDDAPVVLLAKKAIAASGRQPKLFSHSGGMDTCNIVRMGIPAVGMGMGDRQAHSVNEWGDVPHFLDACKVAVFLVGNNQD